MQSGHVTVVDVVGFHTSEGMPSDSPASNATPHNENSHPALGETRWVRFSKRMKVGTVVRPG